MGNETTEVLIQAAKFAKSQLAANGGTFNYEHYKTAVTVARIEQEKAWADRNLEFICSLPQRARDEQNPIYPPGQDPEYDRDYPPCFATLEDVQGRPQKVWHHGQMRLWNDLQGSEYEPPLLDLNQRPWSLNREEVGKGQAFTATHYSESGELSHDYAPPPSLTPQSQLYGQQCPPQPEYTQVLSTFIPSTTYGMSAYSHHDPNQSTSQVQSVMQQSAYGAPGHTPNGFPPSDYGSTTGAANAGFGQHESPF